MKLINLVDCWIYKPETKKVDGENIKKWVYKDHKKLNVQQDVNELDRNSAGLIDYDRIKIRIDYEVSIEKNDGISLKELETDSDGYTVEAPTYKVIAKPKIGRTTTYTCEIYHGE